MSRVVFAVLVLLAGLVHFGCGGGEEPKKTVSGDGEKQDAAAEPAVSPEIAAEMKKPFKRLAFQDYNSDKNGVSDEFDWTGIVIDAPEGANVEVFPARFDIKKGDAYHLIVKRDFPNLEWNKDNIRKDDHNIGTLVDENGQLIWKIKDYSGETEYGLFVEKTLKDKLFVITNDVAANRPRSKEHLDWLLKSAESLRFEGGEPAEK